MRSSLASIARPAIRRSLHKPRISCRAALSTASTPSSVSSSSSSSSTHQQNNDNSSNSSNSQDKDQKDTKSQEKEKEKKEKKPWKLKTFTALTATYIVYRYQRNKARDAALTEAHSVIGPDVSEVQEMARRTRLTSAQLDAIYTSVHQSLYRGQVHLQPDAFGALVGAHVEEIKAQRKEQEQRDKLAKEAQERAAMVATIREELANGTFVYDPNMAGPDPGPEPPKTPEAAKKQAEAKQRADKKKEAAERRTRFGWWDVLCMYRASPMNEQRAIDVREMMVGLAALATDQKKPEDAITDPQLTSKDLEVLNADPTSKMAYAWRFANPDSEGRISYPELVRLLSRMLRTGHIAPETALHRVTFWPPRFYFKSPEEMADSYLADLGLNPNDPQAKEQARIALRDFIAVSYSKTFAKDLEFWYLVPSYAGGLKYWRERWLEKAKRLARAQGLVKPLSGDDIKSYSHRRG